MNSLIFDLDGTIVDVSKRHYAIYLEECKMLKTSPITFKEYWKLKRENLDEKTILQNIINTRNSSFDKVLCWRQKIIESSRILKYDSLFPECVSTLQELKKEYDLKIITSRESLYKTRKQLHDFQILHFFSRVYAFGKNKLVDSNILSEDAKIMIGDTELDYFVAKRLRIPFIFASYGIRSHTGIQKLIDTKLSYSVNRLSALTPMMIEEVLEHGTEYVL